MTGSPVKDEIQSYRTMGFDICALVTSNVAVSSSGTMRWTDAPVTVVG